MTKEEAIKGLKENLCSLCAYGSQNMDSCDIRGCDNRDYIKALEQQPSDDCVSRQAVFETIDDCNIDGLKGIFCSYNAGERFKEYIKKLPPVKPNGATNGDVITAMFPSLKIANDGLINDNLTGIMAFYGGYGSPLQRGDNYFNRKWWDAPYKRGNENGTDNTLSMR